MTIDDFQKQSAQEYGEDTLDRIDSEYSVYLVPKQPVDDLPGLRVCIWPPPYLDSDHPMWTWNWRTVHPGPEMATPEGVPDIPIDFVGGKTEHDTLYQSIVEAAEAAIRSINP